MNTSLVQAQSSADEHTVTTQDIAALLDKQHQKVMASANVLIRQSNFFRFNEYTFLHPVNKTPVLAYNMPYGSAMMLIARLDIDYVPKFLEAATRQTQPIDAIHHDLMFRISIPERWVVEIIKRTQSSVRATLKTARARVVGTPLEKHFELRGSEYWYTPWFLANAPFTKQDGMVFKGALTGLAETLGLTQEMQKYLPVVE